jgi:DNA-binding SARP family transcriptional activator/tetratricopeptide (TPR) repeat protein
VSVSGLEFRVLGPVEVSRDGRPVRVGQGVLLSVLTGLLLAEGRAVTIDGLTDLVWGEDLPEHPRAALHNAVSRLRRLLGPGVLETLPGAYRLRTDADHLDLLRFDRLVAAAADGAPDRAVAAMGEALALWREPLLGNVDSPVVSRDVVPRLMERHLAAVETWADLCLRLDRFTPVVERLPRLIGAHPFRERLVGQLMTALSRAGRQADALSCYDVLRTGLAEDLGIEPSQALQQLHLGILRADPDVLGGGERRPSIRAVVPRQLPPGIADFTGREAEATEILEVLGAGDAPVVVLAGQGGIGKTALAVHCARLLITDHGDGQLYADLRGAGAHPVDPAVALVGFLRALGVAGSAMPDSLEEQTGLYRSLVAERRMVVLLDNAAGEGQVRPLLPGGPACAVIVTSRTRLTSLAITRLIDLDVFDDDHAMDLLGRVVGRERLMAEREHAHSIVRRCGGLPLALRIAGARLAARPHWNVAMLAHRLADTRRRLNELSHGDLDLRATMALSYDGLRTREKSLLARLALLDAPDFAAWVGAALLDIGVEEAEDLFEVLVDARLLDIVDGGAAGSLRYRFHDLVRVYAWERAMADEMALVRDAALVRAFGCWLRLAEHAHQAIYGGDYSIVHGDADRWQPAGEVLDRLVGDRPLAWLDSERFAILATIRQSAELGMDEICWDLAWTAVTLFEHRNYGEEWRTSHEQALTAVRKAENRRGEAAIMLSLAGRLLHHQHFYDEARVLCESAGTLFAGAHDRHGQALAECRLAYVDNMTGRPDSAIRHYQNACQVFRDVGDRFEEIYALRGMALILLDRGEYENARACVDAGLAAVTATGSHRAEAFILHALAECHLRTSEFTSAERVIERLLRVVREDLDVIGETHALLALGEALAGQGRYENARSCLREALDHAERCGQVTLEARALLGLGKMYAAAGDTHAATTSLRRSLALFRRLDAPLWQSRALQALSVAGADQ